MNKRTTYSAAAALGLGLLLSAGAIPPAHATEEPVEVPVIEVVLPEETETPEPVETEPVVVIETEPAPEPEPTVEVFWTLPNGGTPENVTWPQPYLADPSALPCGVWAQVDTYPASIVPGLVADGVLSNGEDHATVISWRFVYGGDCPPVVVPEPEVPTVPELPECAEGEEAQPAGDGYVCGPADSPCPGVELPNGTCPSDATPVEPVAPQEPTTAPVADVQAIPAPVATELAVTGSDGHAALYVGGIVLALGLGLMLVARKRQEA